MKYLLQLKECAARTLSWLCFSNQCLICRSPSVYLPLCSRCQSHLTRELTQSLSSRRCLYCGRPLLSEFESCTVCRREDSVFSPVHTSVSVIRHPFPVFAYIGRKKRLLTTWKITGDRSLSGLYARWIFLILCEKFPCVPVVPVPPRKNKIREKGWDQIEELCHILEVRYGITVLRLLHRTNLLQQKKLNREQRLSSLGADYELLPEDQLHRALKKRLLPERVVLLDDVITTGSTVQHAAAALQSAGIAEVYPVSLFYVP